MTQLDIQPHVLETLGWDSVKKLLDERVLSVPGKSLASKIRPLPIDDAKRRLVETVNRAALDVDKQIFILKLERMDQSNSSGGRRPPPIKGRVRARL